MNPLLPCARTRSGLERRELARRPVAPGALKGCAAKPRAGMVFVNALVDPAAA